MGERSRFRNVLEYGAGRAALFVLNMLPERPAYAALGGLGRLYFRCSRSRQRYALRMLRNAYPEGKTDAELLRIGRVATGNVFKVILDTVRAIAWIKNGRLRERLDLSRMEEIYPDPPFVGVTGHLGSWEVGAIGTGMLCGESHAIARVFKNPLLQRFILRNREQAGLFVHPKRGGIRSLARALERGCVGMQVVDQHQRSRAVRVPFFGEPASTERSAVVLALRKGYPIVVAGLVRDGPGFRFRSVGHEALKLEATGDPEADVARGATEVNRRLEALILDNPEQYLWIHNRYRDDPTDHEHGR